METKNFYGWPYSVVVADWLSCNPIYTVVGAVTN